MTQEEKIKEAKRLYKSANADQRYVLESLFPELKESENERIRKKLLALIEWSKSYTASGITTDEAKEMTAWLESQCEQKPITHKYNVGATIYYNSFGETKSMVVANVVDIGNGNPMYEDTDGNAVFEKDIIEPKTADKVVPKFKVGDWVVDKQGIVHQIANVIKNVYNHTYVYDIVGGYFNDNTEGVRLWTIRDAKDGDVLCSGQIILLFKKWEDNDWNFVIAYAGIDISGKLQITNGHWLISNSAHPATKEQRDLLFSKMKESGYEWDAEKKELKKIEQTPVIEMETPEQSLGLASDTYNKIVDECVYGEQNPAWSEEDEEISDGRENWTEEEWRNYNEFVADAIAEEEEVIEDMTEVDNDY